jgi:zinc-ribbon domain
VATICTHCGREVPPGNTVCPACGETVRSAAPAFTPVLQPGVQTPPGYTPSATSYPIPPQPAQSNGALKIILIVVGVFVVIGVLAAAVVGFGVWRVSRAIVHKNSNGDVSISTPAGTITSGSTSSIDESELGIAIYPGATRGEGSMNMHTPAGSLVSAVFLTSDSPAQVVAFYKAKLGSDVTDVSPMQSGKSTMITSAGDSKNKVMITVTSVDNGKTRINILHTTKK